MRILLLLGAAMAAGCPSASQRAACAAVRCQGNLYFIDGGNYRIRRINANGIITTVAGDADVGADFGGGEALDGFEQRIAHALRDELERGRELRLGATKSVTDDSVLHIGRGAG